MYTYICIYIHPYSILVFWLFFLPQSMDAFAHVQQEGLIRLGFGAQPSSLMSWCSDLGTGQYGQGCNESFPFLPAWDWCDLPGKFQNKLTPNVRHRHLACYRGRFMWAQPHWPCFRRFVGNSDGEWNLYPYPAMGSPSIANTEGKCCNEVSVIGFSRLAPKNTP